VTNFRSLKQLRPAYAAMSVSALLVHRGEVVTFRPNIRSPFHSTDIGGFRHSTFAGKTLSVREIIERPQFGIVLGSSHIFGLGMPGNENTIASLLGDRFGFPFANVCLPEGNTRNLFSLLVAQLAVARRRPAVVVFFNGGDFSSFCVTSMADAVFGSPNLKQFQAVAEERGGFPSADESIQSFMAFSELWTMSLINLCRKAGIPLVLGRDTTFFEKEGVTQFERHCQLGTPYNELQRRWFETHRKFHSTTFEIREKMSAELQIPLAGPVPPTDLTFLDEFHYDREGMRLMFEDIAAAVEPLVPRARP
jgi:hypothetical protein